MKNIFTIILFCLSSSLFSQRIVMIDTIMKMSQGSHPAIQVSIPQITAKALKKGWIKHLESSSKEKSVEIGNENLQPALFITNISSESFIIYSTILETTEGAKLTVWFTPDNVIFYSAAINADQHLAMQKYLYDFSLSAYHQVVLEEFNKETNEGKDMEKELSKLINDFEKSNKTIELDQQSIQKANNDILVNDGDLKELSKKIVLQKEFVDKTAADENANNGAKKTLKDLETQRDGIQTSIDKNNKDIIAWNKEMRKMERNISESIEQQGLKETQITLQKEKIQLLQSKLDTLK